MRSAIFASSAILGVLLIGTAPGAQQSFLSCIDQTQSWSQGFPAGAVAAVIYVVSMPLTPAPPTTFVRPGNTLGWLIKTARTGGVNATKILTGVQSNIASQYQKLTDASARFASDRARYRELLLIDGTGCPLLVQDAQYSITGTPLWTH